MVAYQLNIKPIYDLIKKDEPLMVIDLVKHLIENIFESELFKCKLNTNNKEVKIDDMRRAYSFSWQDDTTIILESRTNSQDVVSEQSGDLANEMLKVGKMIAFLSLVCLKKGYCTRDKINDLLKAYKPDDDKFKALWHDKGKIFRLLSERFCTVEKLYEMYQSNVQDFSALTDENNLYYLLSNEKNICTFEQLSDIYDSNPDKFKAFISKKGNVYYLLSNKKNICTFEQLSNIYDSDLDKFKAFISKEGNVYYLLSNEKNICTFEQLSNIYDSDLDKFKAFISKEENVYDLISDNIYTFEQLSKIYDSDLDKFKAFISKEGNVHDLLLENIYTFEQLSKIYDSNPDKFKGVICNRNACVLFARGYCTYDQIGEIYISDPIKFKVLTKNHTRDFIESGFMSFEELAQVDIESIESGNILRKHINKAREMLNSKQDEQGSLATTMGVEIECFLPRTNSGDLNSIPEWKGVSDKSLKPENEGDIAIEFVSSIFKTKEDLKGIVELCENLHERDAYTNDTCGLHIHIGIFKSWLRDNNIENEKFNLIKQILINYIKLEELDVCFKPRKYKMRLLKKEKDAIRRIINADNINQLCDITQTEKNDRSCASANLEALYKHGTIEFRAHTGTINARNIMAWALCIDGLVALSKEMIDKDNAVPCEPDIERLEAIVQPLMIGDEDVISSHVPKVTCWIKLNDDGKKISNLYF